MSCQLESVAMPAPVYSKPKTNLPLLEAKLDCSTERYDVTRFGNSEPEWVQGLTTTELSLTFELNAQTQMLMTLIPGSPVHCTSDASDLPAGRILEVRTEAITSAKLKITLMLRMDRIDGEFNQAFASSEVEFMVREYSGEHVLEISYGEETRRIVRRLRNEARREGRLGPARYVQ